MDAESRERHEVVLVTRPVETPPDGPIDALLGIVSSSIGMVTVTASTLLSVVEQTVESSVGAALDRIVPSIADAIVGRLDLTAIVMDRVDLNRVVNGALDSLDLTELVLDRVDINAIVQKADIDAIIDRVPVIPLANFVIEEIDLPQIIRESTGGIATDAVNTIRVQESARTSSSRGWLTAFCCAGASARSTCRWIRTRSSTGCARTSSPTNATRR